MEKFYKYTRKHILVLTVLSGLVFCFIHLILDLFHLKFIYPVYIVATVLCIIGIVVGVYQLLLKLKKRLKIIMIILFTIVLIIVLPITFFIMYLFLCCNPTHIVKKNGQEMFAEVNCFFTVNVYYYDYKIPLIINKTPRMKEYYGKGGVDPIKNKNNYKYEVQSITYYDKKGNEVKDFDGTPYIDLSELKIYESDDSNCEETIKFLEKIKEKYKNNFSKIEFLKKDGIKIYFSDSADEIATDDEILRIENIINEYIKDAENIKNQNGYFSYRIDVSNTGYISIWDNTKSVIQ